MVQKNPIYRDTVHTQSYQKYHKKKSFRQHVMNDNMGVHWTKLCHGSVQQNHATPDDKNVHI